MIDILTLDAHDEPTVVFLADLLQDRFTIEQRRRFLRDLDQWNASIPPEAKKVMAMYARHQRRGAFVPTLVNAYLSTMAELANTDEWRRVLSWREMILSLEPEARKAA